MDLEQELRYKQEEDEQLLNERRSSRLQRKIKQTYQKIIDPHYQQDSSSDFEQAVRIQGSQMSVKLMAQLHQCRPKRGQSDRNYREQDEQIEQIVADEEEQGQEEPMEMDVGKKGIFHPEIAQILWRKERVNTQEIEYLVKFKDRSYLQVEWITEQQDQLTTEHAGSKQKLSRFIKQFSKRIIDDDLDVQNETQFFDPSYTEPDRILSCTEIFPVVHPKKGSELKGKWSEMLQLCVSKLLNFTKGRVKYGVFFMEPVNPEKDGCPNYKRVIQHPMDLGTINNRVYLGYYKDCQTFWSEMGLVFTNCRRYNKDPSSDIRRLSDTLRECAIVLYKQWYQATLDRYNQMVEMAKSYATEDLQRAADQVRYKELLDEARCEWMRLVAEKYTLFQVGSDSMLDATRVKALMEEELGQPLELIPNEQEDQVLGVIDQLIELNKVDVPVDQNQIDTLMAEFQLQQRTIERDLDQWNPGQFSYLWLQDDKNQENQENFDEYQFQFIDQRDIDRKLAFAIDTDHLYLVKWKNLSYLEATWEKESNIACPGKLMEFRQFNRSLDKDTRGLMVQQGQRHKVLLDHELGLRKKKVGTNTLNEIRDSLYFYGMTKEPQLYLPSTQPVYKDRKLLRDYQLQSLNWLIQAWYHDRNVILADEMGLGKTVQTIALLNHLHSLEGCRGPFLVIAPLSTLMHWKRTVEEWTNMNAVLYYDSDGTDGRSVCRYYEWYYTDISTKGSLLNSNEIIKFQILIVSYEVFLLDVQNVLLSIPFQYVVVDEAHRLKNQNARILQALKRMPCKRTLLLTGTPVQNNTDELFSLLNFIEPKHFPSAQNFKDEFGDLTSAEQIESLNKLLKPFILRRQKEDVEQQIPPLQETIIDIEMTTIQKTIYKAIYERNKSMLLQGFSQSAASATQLNNLEIQLRKCCNHPFLIKEMHNELTKDCRTNHEYVQQLIESSGKMILLEKLLVKFREEGKKVLIFSQFTFMLALIEEYLKARLVKFEKIDGQIKARDRQNAIDRFNDPTKQRDVFLLSTKAGGQGINLTAAEVVIIYDSDWNPQNDVQATARAHRIGQSKEVAVYRLVTKNTYEAEMFERATRKLGLDQAIFMGGAFKRPEEQLPEQRKLTKQEVEILLKKGILGLVGNEGQNRNLQEQNINDILEKDSRMAKFSMISGSYTIQKHSFVSEKTDSTIQIEDPNFWQIILKNTESKSQKLIKQFEERGAVLNQSQGEQKRFMLEISECVHALVDSKLSHQGYNADDERNIQDLLNQINVSKHFTKKLKDMATNWLYEVQKPSRRFKKITFHDLDVENGIVPFKPMPQIITIKRDPKRPSSGNFSDGEDAKRLAMKSKDELVKKLCYVCERAACSYFCMGYCRRAFHDSCRQFLEKERDWVNEDGLKQEFFNEQAEMDLDEEELRSIINIKYVCPDCTSNQVICNFCKKKGQFYPNEGQGKRTKEEEGEQQAFEDSVSPNNNETSTNNQQAKKVPRIKRKRISELSKCSTANCNRYFHLECIQRHPYGKMLDTNEKLFRCPAHVCAYCKINSSNTTTALIHCVRCCRSFHLKCATPDAKRKMIKVGKKLMLCDTCNKNWKNDTVIKISLEPILPPRSLKQSKLAFKQSDTILKLKRSDIEVPPEPLGDISREEQQPYQGTLRQQANRKRRLKPYDQSPSDSPLVLKKKSQTSLIKRRSELAPITYEELDIVPVKDFDYTGYAKDWCRYCGARFASNFTKGPWGSRTLCTIHYINWGQKKSLDLSPYVDLPVQPINRDDQTELQFIQRLRNYVSRRQRQKDETYDPKRELENAIPPRKQKEEEEEDRVEMTDVQIE